MIACALLGKANAQAIVDIKVDKRKEIIVQSWKKGTETIKNRQIRLALSSKNKKYKQEIVGDSGKRYLIETIHNPYYLTLDLEHWEVKMFEVLQDEGKAKLSENLLSPEQYGTFKQEAYFGILYPEEKPHVIGEDNEVLWGEGKGFYYFKTIRKINIENFCVSIRVGDYKFNKKNKNKRDLFEVLIEFTSTCKES